MASREVRSWPEYAFTPLVDLRDVAEQCGWRRVWFKEEGKRFGLGGFKALGGAYGVLRVLRTEVARRGGPSGVSSADLRAGRYSDVTRDITVTCATDGNHGRSVAWGAQTFGCRCVVYVPGHVSAERMARIAMYGAEMVQVEGIYEDSLRQAIADAERHRRIMVSDAAYPGEEEIPRDIMQAYTVLMDEVMHQLGPLETLTHVFVQAGVGGLAAAVCSYLWETLGPARPTLIVVEPDAANCVYAAAEAGEITSVDGPLTTVMGCLACAEASPVAWRILKTGADYFLTISDDMAVEAMRALADGLREAGPVYVGESGGAGLAGALTLARDAALAEATGLGADSRILLIGTEGAMDPVAYQRLVGRPPQ